MENPLVHLYKRKSIFQFLIWRRTCDGEFSFNGTTDDYEYACQNVSSVPVTGIWLSGWQHSSALAVRCTGMRASGWSEPDRDWNPPGTEPLHILDHRQYVCYMQFTGRPATHFSGNRWIGAMALRLGDENHLRLGVRWRWKAFISDLGIHAYHSWLLAGGAFSITGVDVHGGDNAWLGHGIKLKISWPYGEGVQLGWGLCGYISVYYPFMPDGFIRVASMVIVFTLLSWPAEKSTIIYSLLAEEFRFLNASFWPGTHCGRSAK